MKILLVHNFYQYHGGEDEVVENEKELLEKRGNEVFTYFINSDEINRYSPLQKLLIIPRTIYNKRHGLAVVQKAKETGADIVHVHNFWPIISPSIFFHLNKANIPYIQTVHNFRYTVANALLNKEDWDQDTKKLKIQKRSFNSYKKSFLMTFTYWLTARYVRWSKVFQKGNGNLLFLNKFGKDVQSRFFVGTRIFIKGNFLPRKNIYKITNTSNLEAYFLFLGRISEEKGIEILLDAYIKKNFNSKLKIAGTGPLLEKLKHKYPYNNIEFLGFVSGEKKAKLISQAKALIIPSTCLENFPVTIIEANMYGIPVIASNSGGIPELIDNNKTGILFESGNISELYEKLVWSEKHYKELEKMGKSAKLYAEDNYSEEKNYINLLSIYKSIIN